MKRKIDISMLSLQEIADWLLLQGTLNECPGLIYGKTGIALFFFHYARYTSDKLFEEYAWDLLEQSQLQIHANFRPDYEKGIAGIGVGIDYLIRHDFLDVTPELFDDLDERMYRAVMYEPCINYGLFDGWIGFGRYWIMRQSTSVAQECLERITEQVTHPLRELSLEEWTDLQGYLLDLRIYLNWEVDKFPSQPPGTLVISKKRSLVTNTLGLLFGYAGEGMTLLTAMGCIDSQWKRLIQSN